MDNFGKLTINLCIDCNPSEKKKTVLRAALKTLMKLNETTVTESKPKTRDTTVYYPLILVLNT
ncbi:hypothetical protein FRX31_002320 [Thalictrum thalictroides]|uniref:Uncharacterized protein n=1 Tax=Thalictrum thalictroides TaxID=46969 RepID=A0A7J6XGA6_THATH|nr:hypothetical protein FRX31_002320 [Thalictrum thalictroides]